MPLSHCIKETPQLSIAPQLCLHDLAQYLQLLPVTTLPAVPGLVATNISDLAKLLSSTHQSLNQNLEIQKTQSSLDSWLQHT